MSLQQFKDAFRRQIFVPQVIGEGALSSSRIKTWRNFFEPRPPGEKGLWNKPGLFAKEVTEMVARWSKGDYTGARHPASRQQHGARVMIGVNLTGLNRDGSPNILSPHASWGSPAEDPARWKTAGYGKGEGWTDYEIALSRQPTVFPYVRWFEEYRPGLIRQLNTLELLSLGITPHP